MPQWETTERHNYLISLWIKYGNKCLLGHNACPIAEHYIDTYSKLVYVPYSKLKDCINTQGQPRFDDNGQRLQILEHLERKTVEHRTRFIRLFDLKMESIIKNWIDDDRERDKLEREIESKYLHETNFRIMPLRGQFSGISRDIYYDNQPVYYLEAIGVSGITLKPFAKLRLASSGVRLYVDISDVITHVSKNKRRKFKRYSKPIAKSTIALTYGVDLRSIVTLTVRLN